MNFPEDTKAIVIDPNGSKVVTFLSDLSLKTLQEAVGGYIEPIPTDDRLTMWVNEEGMDVLPVNLIAMLIWTNFDIYGCLEAGQFLYGPCVITGPNGSHGNTTPITPLLLKYLSSVFRSII